MSDSAPGKMISISLKDKPTVYYSYMPFFAHGGFFVPTSDPFKMGDEVLLMVDLLDHPDKFILRTHVAWINQNRTSNGQSQGIGLAFGDDETAIKCRMYVEEQLPGLLHTDRATYTM